MCPDPEISNACSSTTLHNQEEAIMKATTNLSVTLAIVLFLVPATGHTADVPGIPPETVADYIYAVIANHRAFYTHVVERLEEQGEAKADGEWRTQKKTIPLPVQLVTETSNMFSAKFAGLRYRLISLWPINSTNRPIDQPDRSSLEALVARPEQAVTRTVKIDGQTYFRAVYADLAVRQACVACHNAHPNSPKKDFHVGDVMGGLVIEFPLGHQ
jgi:hypothetical protein